ncbi:EF-hand domain-containing protein 1 isoform X2 [Hydra vulgaris]|uniref:EF-hand domain-containing protein 1 isoform X2 n=1 Tax=Hydra vulgaris TaxID=6087 RepID=A0ABM4BSJ8_HYDVU
MALPFLPGNSFADPNKTRYHLSQTLGYKNGYTIPKVQDTNALTENDLDELANYQPTLTYGKKKEFPLEQFLPAHVIFDKKVLMFKAFFKQTVHESHDEFYCVRLVKIYYYLEDDSIMISEPVVENSGIPQGKLIKRQRLPKNEFGDTWHWKDFNIGAELTIYGKTFKIYDCDEFTKEYMASEGIVLNQPEECPSDLYNISREQPHRSYKTPTQFDKLKQFIELDRKVLRFFCIWDDSDKIFGEIRPCILHFFLVDNTMEIREIHTPNDGRDPFPVFIGRRRIPIDLNNIPVSFPAICMELSENEITEWFEPKHFKIGETLFILGRRFLLYDCDNFTKSYYREKFNVQEFTPLDVTTKVTNLKEKQIPPYNGYGSLEDSLQSCLSLIPQPPKKDFIKILENANKVLRYLAIMKSVHAEDKLRHFIISYYLSDEMIAIYEKSQRNSGILGGKFLERTRVQKPGSHVDSPEFYTPADFAIGAVMEIFKHRFIITDADEYVLKYLESGKFPISTINSIRIKHGKEPLETLDGINTLKENELMSNSKHYSESQSRYTKYDPEYKWKV